ncbi:fz domain protein [Dictyocaulus viviparus]|uniref:Fz domain protein n=1 Tax=Dictyocaulus viviparus TaxID=29172 RepID=A0A0D8Y519_DICVI|nr:fz domain protein [Dictyocaulus viviparus]
MCFERFCKLVFLTLIVLSCNVKAQVYHQQRLPSNQKCVPLKISMCIDVPYNTTVYPNLLNHQSQDDAEIAINQYHPLVKVKCSGDIKLFLCTVYAPICTPLEEPIRPCRDLCLSAKNGCESLMIKFGFRWPEQLECKHFPTEGLCVGQNKTSSTPSPSRSYSPTNSLECPLTMTASVRSHFALPLSSGTLEDCSLPCAADNLVPVFFDKRHRRYLRFWTGGWAVACCVCALFTITTFTIDLARFAYPVRPILYMAVCYLVISVVYMIGVVGEDSFACGPYGETPQLLVTQGGEGTACSALAVAHYYFTIASSVWWVVLCLAWFLAANRKWGAESIAGLAPYLHAASWGMPALLSVIVLVTNSIDGDIFTGICSVGNLQPKVLFYYLFLPIIGCIILGLFLLACGICSMMRIRTYIKLQHADVDKNIRKLEKLMFRVGGFAVMYVLPTAASAAVLCYQAVQMPFWLDMRPFCCSIFISNTIKIGLPTLDVMLFELALYTLRCIHPDRVKYGFSMPRTSCNHRMDNMSPGPELILIFIKYLCQLIVGITCAVWICSAKTVASYQKVYVKIILRRSAVATDEH